MTIPVLEADRVSNDVGAPSDDRLEGLLDRAPCIPLKRRQALPGGAAG